MIRSFLLVAVIFTAGFVFAEANRLPSPFTNIEPSAIVVIGGKTYFFSPKAEQLEDAYTYCNGLDLKLVSLDTEEKSDLFTDYFATAGISEEHWTSGFRMVNSFVWSAKGTVFSYTNWAANEPNYVGTSPVGVVISSSGKWLDYPEYSSFKYICEEQEVACK